MAKVVLVDSPSWLLFSPRSFLHLGIMYLAASLRAAGHGVSLADCHSVTSWDAARRKLVLHRDLMEECDVLGVSATTANAHWGAAMAQFWPARYKVLGGTHATYILDGPHERFKKEEFFRDFDYAMVGECEESLAQFCGCVDRGVEPKDQLIPVVPGLRWFRQDGSACGHAAPIPPDVTKLAQPAFDLWPGGFVGGGLSVKSVRAGDRALNEEMTASLYTARGCPYGCRFCADARSKVREESICQIESQVKELARLGVKCVRIQDDVLTLRAQRCRYIADVLHEHGMKWRGNTRVNLTDPSLFAYLSTHGCTELGFGCEHGSARMLEAMGKGTTPEKNAEGIRMCQGAGMAAKAFLMLGFPGENDTSVNELLAWTDQTRPDMVALCLFQPFPGSDVWNRPERYGVRLPDAPFDRFWQQGLDDDPSALVLDPADWGWSRERLLEQRKTVGEWIDRNIGHRDRTRVDAGSPGLGVFGHG